MKIKICVIVANYYPNISKFLLIGAIKALRKKGVRKYKIIKTKGTYEIPVIISKIIKKYDAFIALGCVIKGETPHFKFISSSTIDALMYLSVKNTKPIGNGIITSLNKKQALVRSNPKLKDKGGEAVLAALSVLKVKK